MATGGLPQQNALFGEIVAAVLGAPVEVPAVEHGPALGAAVLGALAAGRFATAAEAVDAMAGASSVVPPPRVIEPDPAPSRPTGRSPAATGPRPTWWRAPEPLADPARGAPTRPPAIRTPTPVETP